MTGEALGEWTFRVEAGKIAEFARAVGDPSPADPLLAPPTFLVVASAGMVEDLVTRVLQLDRTRTVHGEQAYEYVAPVRAGMLLRCVARMTGDLLKPGRSGGDMRVITVEVTHHDSESGALLVRETMTTIEKGV